MGEFLESLLNPIYVAAVGVIAGFFLKWWTEGGVREYEREAKRLQFFKAFYDLDSLAKPSVSPEFDRRCQQLLRDASRWMESRPTKGASFAKGIAIGVALFCGSLTMGYVSIQLSKGNVKPRPEQLFTNIMIEGFFAICTFMIVYQLILLPLTDLSRALAGFRWFRRLNEAKW